MITATYVVVAVVALGTLFRVLRAGRLREKYAALWIVVGLMIVVVGLWPGLLGILAGWLSVQVPSNLLFFLAIILLLGVALHLSLAVSQLEDEARALAEEVAILRLRTEQQDASDDG